jgi:hypothetical protein
MPYERHVSRPRARVLLLSDREHLRRARERPGSARNEGGQVPRPVQPRHVARVESPRPPTRLVLLSWPFGCRAGVGRAPPDDRIRGVAIVRLRSSRTRPTSPKRPSSRSPRFGESPRPAGELVFRALGVSPALTGETCRKSRAGYTGGSAWVLCTRCERGVDVGLSPDQHRNGRAAPALGGAPQPARDVCLYAACYVSYASPASRRA